jgi:hypothetical protein
LTKIYRFTSIIFRVLNAIAAVLILFLHLVFSRLVEEDDLSLLPHLLFCVFSVIVITFFHKTSAESLLSKFLQVISIAFITSTIAVSFYLILEIIGNFGSYLALIFLSVLLVISIPLLYFVIRNRKYVDQH